MKNFLRPLGTVDVINAVFFTVLSIFMAACAEKIPLWRWFVAINLGMVVSVFVLAKVAHGRHRFWRLVHGYYVMICIPLAFKQMYYLVPALNPHVYDSHLIAVDYMLFGVHPTHWIYQFQHPILTEILQIAYSTFYALPLILSVDLYRKNRMRAFKLVFSIVILGFYLSYIGYCLVPGIGPRFTLHEFEKKDQELPGLFLTPLLRAYVNSGESIPPGTQDPAAKVQRDVFPSGHTEVTLLVIFLAFRYRARTRWFLGITGSLLIIATVYMRYHYAVDLIGGALFALLTLKLGYSLNAWWENKTGSEYMCEEAG